ncbi:hypothetical protein THAOC_27378 [Thalassiosira oceanica]|uniref:Uncharacterized protein n=1 Tax=Thalassiosira oceanica TaxID=159749 RepID=K0RJ47_THAOC|nr:hypothetical protein THAOC_27378 [Thalassiosira oceanica]|eukprot:EJK53235.1 hypothetical protein THAOC_27378 [Thalassiosira oceanica]
MSSGTRRSSRGKGAPPALSMRRPPADESDADRAYRLVRRYTLEFFEGAAKIIDREHSLVSTKKGGIDGELTVETREQGWKEFIAEHNLDQNGGKNLAEATQTRTSVDIFRWLKEGEEPSEDNRARIVLIRLGGYKDKEVIKGSLQITDRVECPEFNKSEKYFGLVKPFITKYKSDPDNKEMIKAAMKWIQAESPKTTTNASSKNKSFTQADLGGSQQRTEQLTTTAQSIVDMLQSAGLMETSLDDSMLTDNVAETIGKVVSFRATADVCLFNWSLFPS